MKMKKLLVGLALAQACCLSAQNGAVAPSDTLFPFNVGLRSTDSVAIGSKIALRADGKPTLLAFWLTTCYPCMIELDTYTKKYADWQKESPFHLMAISTDFPKNFRRIGQVVAERKFPFPVFWDENRAFRYLLPGGLNGLPQVFLFDKNGKLVWHHKGFYTGLEEEVFAKIKSITNSN